MNYDVSDWIYLQALMFKMILCRKFGRSETFLICRRDSSVRVFCFVFLKRASVLRWSGGLLHGGVSFPPAGRAAGEIHVQHHSVPHLSETQREVSPALWNLQVWMLQLMMMMVVVFQWQDRRMGKRRRRGHGRRRLYGDGAWLPGAPGGPAGPRTAEIPETPERSANTHPPGLNTPHIESSCCSKSSCSALDSGPNTSSSSSSSSSNPLDYMKLQKTKCRRLVCCFVKTRPNMDSHIKPGLCLLLGGWK